MPKFKPRTVRIEEIIVDPRAQTRTDGIDEKHVAQMVEDVKELPPPLCVEVDGEIRLADGFHRLKAFRLAKMIRVAILVAVGTEDDWVDAFASANDDQKGKHRTRDDKRASVVRVLELRPKWSNRRIAEAAKVGDQLVATIRTSATPQVRDHAPETQLEDKREGKDGKQYKATQPKVTATKPVETAPEPEPKDAPDFIADTEASPEPEPVIEPPISAPATEPVATVDEEPPEAKKAYKVPAVDKDGIPIQEWAVEAFESVPEFRDLIRLIKDVRKRFSALADTPGGRFLLRRGQWTTLGKNEDGSDRGIWRFDYLENLLMLLEDTIPQHTDCPYAHNPFAPHDGDQCVTCRGLRWTPKQLRSNTAKEIVAALFQNYGIEGAI